MTATVNAPDAPDAPDAAETTRAPGSAGSSPRTRRYGGPLLGLLAWVIGIIFVLPVLWMILTSFHSEQNAGHNPPYVTAPLDLDGYRDFFSGGTSPWPYLLNSLTASVVSTALVLLLAIPAAYALSIRPVRKWTDVMFFFLSTKMLPPIAGLLPIYLFAQKVDLLDNVFLLIVLYMSMNLPIAVWMMRSFLAEVPRAILEAASLDGASLPYQMRRIIVPITMPGIAATSLICFIFSWNELLFARVLTGVAAQTAPVFLTSFVTSQGLFLAKVCAAATIVSLPVLAAGFAAQDKLVQGLSLGAVK
ncbi:carbohydrate ABC transporter membrane protein 2, CUT1 family [Jatrophihabitans endophyticus]|uniref:Carbohydrate ABC transporter membrane protein 2, CUT1 family n=1 Tax=Jatrophihabitans endophyticus TaxID=1206085 RepID=A0A1M5HEW6_9ACTN|nr:carbohydrate ABC transporter permease [Jatrophihabitans endophyticus]SHG14477.1 carbohydrate ABC transporter membrane protein 2, CUT1 family [Jatrophihabitans endophyticus]